MPESLLFDVEHARRYLDKQHMKADDDWLQGCVEFFRNETGQGIYNTEELNNMVRDQWMLCDLREMCPGSLPPKLSEQIKTVVNGNHVLQMNYLVNIAAPAYQQLQKLRKVNTTNIEVTAEYDSTKSESIHRMLKLYLTDGVQDISGLEYKPMRNLNCNLIPGVKILLKGPVQCRRGALLLEEKHISVLGGEVDNLIAVNSFDNVLARTIGWPINDSGRPTTASALEVTQEVHNQEAFPQSDVPSATVDNAIVQDLNTDDFADYDDIDIDQIAALENQLLHKVDPSTKEALNQHPQSRNTNNDLYRMTPAAVDQTRQPLSESILKPKVISNYEWSPPLDEEPSSNIDDEISNMVEDEISAYELRRIDSGDLNKLDDQPSMINTNLKRLNQSESNGSNSSCSNTLRNVTKPIKPAHTSKPTSNVTVQSDSMKSRTLITHQDRLNFQLTNACKRVSHNLTNNVTNMNKNNFEMEPFAKPSKKQKISSDNLTHKYTDIKLDELTVNAFTDTFNESLVSEPQPSTSYSTNQFDNEVKPVGSIITIDQLLKIQDCRKFSHTFTVKSRIKTLIGKLQLTKGCWSLKCSLDDGTGLLDVDFSNEILSGMIGYSPAEMSVIKKEMNVRPDLKEKVMKGLERTKEQLQNLHAFIDIAFIDKNPRIINIRE